ncbi:L-alanine exporter AlaE [Brevundimonas sp.]|uniref:L-alanine exporter AlaE n=1 Tax=Brevundimonas sp. TaxID=1871086 RepID=UPI002D25F12F|nr:L-alanine exporter AlaE [Brevundimonas sp.]HYC69256.1 L-alanine exporter AlaE [Brevundimonas sp.]
MRRFLADTFAMVAFSTAAGLFIEVVVADLTIGESARVRLSALPVILLAGRFYGLYRDWLFRRAGGRAPGGARSALLDTFANTSFQAGLYSALLAVNGIHWPQSAKALLFVITFSVLAGRPYGLFLTWVRKLCGASSAA